MHNCCNNTSLSQNSDDTTRFTAGSEFHWKCVTTINRVKHWEYGQVIIQCSGIEATQGFTRVDISMSDCSNSWQVFGESWYITLLLIQCDISTFHKQLPNIWTIGHRYIYSIQSSVFRVWSGSDLKKINWFRIVSWYVTCLQGWCKNKYGSYLSVDLSYHTRPWTISKLGSINCVLPKYWSKI